MFRLVVSKRAERRLQLAREWVLQHAGAQELLVLAPTRGAADDLLRSAAFPRGWFGVHRTTPYRLAAELATPTLAAEGSAPVSGLGVEALAARALAIATAHGDLAYFRPVADAPGMARALAGTLTELRLGKIAEQTLAATGPPGQDLARLALAYAAVLERAGLADQATLLARATAAIASTNRSPLGLPLLLLDLSPLTLAERDFLAAVARRAPAVLATAASGDDEGITGLAELLAVAPEELESSVPMNRCSRLERLRQGIFSPTLQEFAAPADSLEPVSPPDLDLSLVFLAAPGEGREAAEIARQIHGLARAGQPYDQIAILLRHPEGYLPLIEEALTRAGIPAYFTRGATRPHPSGRAFLALLACASEGLTASRFAEYLSLGQIPQLAADGAPAPKEVPWVEPQGDQLVFKSLLPAESTTAPADDELLTADEQPAFAGTLRTPQRWERLLVDAAVVGGRDRWARRLEGLANELHLQLREQAREDQPQREALIRRLAELEHLQRFALPLIATLDALPQRALWGEWLRALAALATQGLRHPEAVLGVLAELKPMEPVGPVTCEEVRRVLAERLTLLRSEPQQHRYGKVFVGAVQEARGRSFTTVFLPGLAEGIFPRPAAEDPLLLDAFREAPGIGLPTRHQRVRRERLLLRLAAGAANERLVVSYPNLDTLNGRSRVPSFYALDVLRAAWGQLPDQRQLEAHAAASSSSLLGWPAPRTPELAIDDSEYDLAVLDPLLRQPAAKTHGQAYFLLAANEHLGRSLRTRWQRWRTSFSPADGIVAPDVHTQTVLAEHRLRQRSYSPTALQQYASCPYRFLLYAIHRLKPRDEVAPLEQLDPLTRGSLFHEVQFELFQVLAQEQLLPMRASDFDRLRQFADDVLAVVAARYREELAPAIPRVFADEIEDLRTDLHGWIRWVVAAAEPWRPAYFELAFGLDPQGGQRGKRDFGRAQGEATVLDGYRLRGAIDLVEADDHHGTLRVTDHKTGKARKAARLVVGGGEVLQPLLYALVAQELLARPVESGRLFFCTRRGEYHTLEVALDDVGRERVTEVLATIDRAVSKGWLPAAPAKGACRTCDYRLVCGPLEERRLARKKKEDPDRLALEHLRGLP